MLVTREIHIPGFQKVIEGIDTDTGLHSFIAIHDSTLGPTLGGVRIYPYSSPEEALTDVLELAKCMTYKAALIECGLGGGKSVIIANPLAKTKELLQSFGEFVNTLKGTYIAAEDVGSTPDDLLTIRETTPYVLALPILKSSGDPSRFTARGVVKGMQAVATTLWGSEQLKGKKIAIQGLGHVGSNLAEFLFWEGAELIVTDINPEQLLKTESKYKAEVVDIGEIHRVPCDIFSPCALGGAINKQTLPELRCKAIAGSANNQLASPDLGRDLMKKGILYAPDYIINAGGLLNVAAELEPQGYDPRVARDNVNYIYERLLDVFQKSEMENKPPNEIADEIAEYNLLHKAGIRTNPINFH